MDSYYLDDHIPAVDARFEAQKIAFGPFSFQAAYAMKQLGMLDAIAEVGDQGINREDISAKTGLSHYAVNVLLEIGLGLGMMKYQDEEGTKVVLGKIGYFLYDDYLTKVNMDFMQDVCYDGAKELSSSLKSGKPEGLKHFGSWSTVYEALSLLPNQAKKSWFAFDHNYSDHIFPESLPVVFQSKPKQLFDIG